MEKMHVIRLKNYDTIVIFDHMADVELHGWWLVVINEDPSIEGTLTDWLGNTLHGVYETFEGALYVARAIAAGEEISSESDI